MLSVSNTGVYNLENAARGVRNPMNSWERADSGFNAAGEYILGENDLKLLRKLCAAGSDHRKFMRQIFVSADIHAPLYWWKEFDTYKVGTTSNSTSTMHKISSKPFSLEDFSHDRLSQDSIEVLLGLLAYLELLRNKFNETKDKGYWYNIIQLLPSSYMQLRTCTMSYENLRNMYFARKDHKLDEWHVFCAWIKALPYAAELICEG